MVNKVGVVEIVGRIVNDLKDESEFFWKMVMEIIIKVVFNIGVVDIDECFEVLLIDGIIYFF